MCLVSMVASHLNFRESYKPTGSSCLIQLTQNQLEKLFRSVFITKNLYHLGPPLHLLGEPFQADGLRVMQEREKSISLGLPPLRDLGIDPTPTLPQTPQGFSGASSFVSAQ